MSAWTSCFRPSRENESIASPQPSSIYDEKYRDCEVYVQESDPAVPATGAAKIEAVEAVGGRKGRYLLYAGYVISSPYCGWEYADSFYVS